MTVYVKTDNGGTLNLRAAAKSGSQVLDKIPNNTKLNAPNGIENEWTKVTYKNTEGYVMSKYLSTSENTQVVLQKIYDSLKETLKLIEGALK